MKTENEEKTFSTPSWAQGVDSLTKREFFAAMALQGLLANPERDNDDGVIKGAVFFADRVIKELAQR